MMVIVAIMCVVALVIDIITGSGIITILGVLATAIGTSFALSKWYAGTDEDEDKTQQPTAPDHQPRPTSGERGTTDEEMTDAEWVKYMQNNINWQNRGKRNYPNRSVWIFWHLRRLVSWLPVSDRSIEWSRRVAMIIGVLAYFWGVMLLVRILDQVVPFELFLSGQLLEAVLSVIYLIPLVELGPVFGISSEIVSYAVYLGVPMVIVLIMAIFIDSRRQSTCPKCERSFTLKCLGCYNKGSDRNTKTETDQNGEPYTVTKEVAQQALQCRHPGCENYTIRQTGWTDQ